MDCPSITNIYCIGRNYAEHAQELGNAIPTEPLVFLKPTGAVCRSGATAYLPAYAERVDHEVELVLRIARDLDWHAPLAHDETFGLVSHFAVGIDFTARDLQDAAKKKGNPWSVAKGFETSAALGPFLPASALASPTALDSLSLELAIDGAVKQSGSTSAMLFDCATLINFLGSRFRLLEGDLIFTGTPPGVGPVAAGTRIEAKILEYPASRLNLGVERSPKPTAYRFT